ncbi:putative tRNA pseudouridine synthase Pus10-like protein [Leptotrombidium deliense]|uniref:tRNA pseudouridine(55) synthase n=1 Tax=Leptotrombidium deliense TaxID=299467 RepID=A0A443SN56_9ACAR|nr:putative tRNA pseudouridine synthase Pus10-like protein [Leptotrombidium deliense]
MEEELTLNSRTQIFNTCISLGCCQRCSLRFLGSRNFAKLTTINENELEEFTANFLRDINASDITSEPIQPNKKLANDLCISCLGLLQSTPKSMVINEVLEAIEQKGLKFDEFHLNVSLPAVLTLRSAIVASKVNKLFEKAPNDIFTVKDIWKNILSKRISERFNVKLSATAALQISVAIIHENDSIECSRILNSKLSTENSKTQKVTKNGTKSGNKKFNHTSIPKMIDTLSQETLCDWELDAPLSCCDIGSVECVFNSIFVVGRYNKYSRNLSQTPWIIDGEKKMETSVQDIVVDKMKLFIPFQKSKFSACGREDVDVRMLGRGRPFVVELIEPAFVNISEDVLNKIENAINKSSGDVAVHDLQLSTKDDVNYNLKQGEENKTKEYAALCCFDRSLTEDDLNKIENIHELEIHQKTPIRVLHRRSLVTRKRKIYKASAKRVDERTATVVMLTEAGTYVKEFVHSDFGRTYPSLATIVGNCKTDIIELDVLV